MIYNTAYRNIPNLFGEKPEQVLVNNIKLLDKNHPILDVGIGQGRNSIHLAENGYSVIGIDPSKTAIDIVTEIAVENNYPIELYNLDFSSYNPGGNKFSGVLIFGLIQILTIEETNLLIENVNKWLISNGVVFITGFSVLDASYEEHLGVNKSLGKNSFINQNNEIRTFLELGEIQSLFKEFRTLHHWEGFSTEHRHGDGPVEKHHMIEAIFQK